MHVKDILVIIAGSGGVSGVVSAVVSGFVNYLLNARRADTESLIRRSVL
jgi:hypothetical protein